MNPSFKSDRINTLIEIEGGYVNDAADSGGATRWGITEQVARQQGYQGAMAELLQTQAAGIYAALYWDSLHLDQIESLSPEIAEELFDTGVNLGVARAAEFLQTCLNVLNQRGTLFADVVVDGDLGRNTLRAFEAYRQHRGRDGDLVLYRMLNCLQGSFYIELATRREKDERFVFGWMKNRVV